MLITCNTHITYKIKHERGRHGAATRVLYLTCTPFETHGDFDNVKYHTQTIAFQRMIIRYLASYSSYMCEVLQHFEADVLQLISSFYVSLHLALQVTRNDLKSDYFVISTPVISCICFQHPTTVRVRLVRAHWRPSTS